MGYERDGYGKGKDEERKEKIMEWLRRGRGEEGNRRNIRKRANILGRLKREGKKKRGTRMRSGRKIEEDGNRN